MQVVGVDGCPGGWLAAVYDSSLPSLALRVHASFQRLLSAYPEAVCVAVDIPLGLALSEARSVDGEARKVLGPRRSSVFPAPDSRLLDVIMDESLTYAQASERSRSLLGKGISRQAFGIFPKVYEVNKIVTPELQKRVIEVHPEVSFWALAGERPMEHPKKKPEGFAERHDHLRGAFEGLVIPPRREAGRVAPPAGADDVLDAIVAAWTASRFARGMAGRLPAAPPVDERGLRMEMVY